MRMDAGRKALLERGDDEAGPYQSPMEDGMQHFHEWYRRRELGAEHRAAVAGARSVAATRLLTDTDLRRRTRDRLRRGTRRGRRSTAASTWATPPPASAHWRAGHLPGALYVHLDRDLSGATTGRNGRHPLARAGGPAPASAAVAGAAAPVPRSSPTTPRAAPATRRAPWWMLRWLGHEAVAVLDGGSAGLAAPPAARRHRRAAPRPRRPTPPPARR